ncbi:MAG: hypothetical protein IKP19_09075, partial [Oscillospiraceae bacterium]|nr:hypothetical protein [Oscillospiraceae bacterium]
MASPTFPTAKQRKKIIEDLLKAEEQGQAPSADEHYRAYLEALRQLNALMDDWSRPEGRYGLPRVLDEAGKEALMTAIANTAALGETFLADAQRRGDGEKPGKAVLGMTEQVQQLLAGDYEMLSAYKPQEAQLSFPELQENARTEIIDLRGQSIRTMSGAQSSRIPMTVVDAEGKRRRGVFTKAQRLNDLERFKQSLEQIAAYYDTPAFKRKQMEDCKSFYLQSGRLDRGLYQTTEDIGDEMIIGVMKGRVKGLLEGFRRLMAKEKKKVAGGAPHDADENMLLGEFGTYISTDSQQTEAFLKLCGLGLEAALLPDLFERLQDTITKAYAVNAAAPINNAMLMLKDGDRLDHRSSAMSAVAALLGVPDLVARSTNMKYLDENGNPAEGTFTEFAKGLDLMGAHGGKLMTQLSGNPLDSPNGLAASLADLQVLDYICGNVDRHAGNMSYLTNKEGRITGIQAFDNDSSFGLTRPDKTGGVKLLPEANKLQVVTKSMAARIKAISPEMLSFVLRGRGLKPEEVEAACLRLQDLKQALNRSREVSRESQVRLLRSQNALAVMDRKSLNQMNLHALAEQERSIFSNVKKIMGMYTTMYRMQYPYKANARQKEAELTEISTTDRSYVAGGIADTLGSMGRAIENKVVGFKVGDLSKFLRSSDRFRSMVSAVKAANAAAQQIRQSIGRDKEQLRRDSQDPQVRAQRELADRSMTAVRRSVEAYLQKKMTERNVQRYEDLKTAGKNAYEQKRINYALGLLKSVESYESFTNPEN